MSTEVFSQSKRNIIFCRGLPSHKIKKKKMLLIARGNGALQAKKLILIAEFSPSFSSFLPCPTGGEGGSHQLCECLPASNGQCTTASDPVRGVRQL